MHDKAAIEVLLVWKVSLWMSSESRFNMPGKKRTIPIDRLGVVVETHGEGGIPCDHWTVIQLFWVNGDQLKIVCRYMRLTSTLILKWKVVGTRWLIPCQPQGNINHSSHRGHTTIFMEWINCSGWIIAVSKNGDCALLSHKFIHNRSGKIVLWAERHPAETRREHAVFAVLPSI